MIDGNKIKYIRKKIGLTQKEFAEKLNIPMRTFMRYENNETTMPLHFVDVLAKIGNIEPDFFMCHLNNPKSTQMQSGSNNVQVGGNHNATQVKNEFEIEDKEIAVLCFAAYTAAKTLNKLDKLKEYLALAPSSILK